MLQPSSIMGSLVGGLGPPGIHTPEGRVSGGGVVAGGAGSPGSKGGLVGEELLPLSTAGSSSSAAKVLAQVQVGQQSPEDEERISLLEDGRQDGTGKRHTSSKERGGEKLEKRRARSSHVSSHPDGWNVRENFLFLWGGSNQSGLLCMLASALCYSLMGLLVRLLQVHTIPPFETVALRCAIISLLAGAGLAKQGHPLLGSPNLRLLLTARALLGFLALCAFFYSISVLPLRDATVLNFTAPVFTSVLAMFFLEEKFTTREMAAAAASLVGVLMINQPPILFGGQQALPDLAVTAEKRQESLLGILAALLSAALGGAAFCLVRAIGKAGEPPLAVVFVFSAFTCVASLFCLLIFQTFVIPTPGELAGMIAVSVVAFAAQVLLTRALQLEKAGRATAMQYMKVVGTYVLGVLFWGELPSLKGAAGVIVIGVSLMFVALNDKESARGEERA